MSFAAFHKRKVVQKELYGSSKKNGAGERAQAKLSWLAEICKNSSAFWVLVINILLNFKKN